jgi:Flp pilus assembly protein CpaB
MQKKRSPLIPVFLALAAGLLTVILLTTTVRPTDTVVAAINLAPGTRLSPDLLEVRSIPAGGRAPDAFSQILEVEGKVLVVGRVAGDPITVSVLGGDGDAGLPSELAQGTVAIAIRVDQATGVAGLLRAGESVTVIGLMSPEVMSSLSSSIQLLSPLPADDLNPLSTTPSPTPAPTPVYGPLGRIVISGVRVLMVPQNFQYQEVPATADQEELFASVQATTKESSVIVLEVPVTPLEIAPGLVVNPATLLAALDHFGQIHLGLEPAGGIDLGLSNTLTLNLAEYYREVNRLSNSATRNAQ